MKLVIDMNLSPAWVALLEAAGHSAVHWSSVGPPNAPDMEIMGWAADHDSIVLTHDLDFSAILAASGERSPSVVQIRADNLAVTAIGAMVLTALDRLAEELASGALVTIEPHRTRLTVLPLARSKN